MQSTLGFWIFTKCCSLIGTYSMFYADDGFGTLTPCPCPVHVINTTLA